MRESVHRGDRLVGQERQADPGRARLADLDSHQALGCGRGGHTRGRLGIGETASGVVWPIRYGTPCGISAVQMAQRRRWRCAYQRRSRAHAVRTLATSPHSAGVRASRRGQ